MEEVMSGWWVPLLGSIFTFVIALLAFGINKLAKYIIVKASLNETEQEAMQALLEGMAKAQDEIVREAKKAAADGKLTKDEIKAAEKMAIEHAVMVAKGPAKELVLSWGERKIQSLIKQLLARFKG